MNKSNCASSHSGQAGQGEQGGSGRPVSNDRKPTGQAGTGQSDDAAGNSGAPEDYDSDPQGGGGKLDQVNTDAEPARGADAASHGSR